MRFPDLLASKWGRMTAFFFLYLTEGIPLGFTATAVATQMRRQGLSPLEIGAFVGSLYLPWAFKWVMGPIVDVVSSDRWGRRRAWIVGAQAMMIVTLMTALPVNFTTDVKLFTLLILLNNIFGATQDVAIDALAVNVLKQEERGLANGLMFGGAYLGQAIGGSGVLFLTPLVGFQNTYFFVCGVILAVLVFIVLPLREKQGERPAREGPALAAIGSEIGGFAKDSVRAFLGTRAAFVGVIFALLPAGAYALGLALQSNLAVELGLNDSQVGFINLWSSVISAIGCVAGGWLSDRFGRRLMLAVFIAGTAVPTIALAIAMRKAGWVMPVDPQMANRPLPSPELLSAFWVMVLVYSGFNGLMYGTRTAQFMDITVPRVAATQFTAYMAMLNFVISYSANWQGWAVTRWGYPVTLAVDSAVGLVCLGLLPLMQPAKRAIATLAPGAAVEPAIG